MLFLYFHSNWVTTHVIPQGVLGQHNTDTSLGAPEWCPIWLVVSMSMKNMIVFGNHPAVWWLEIKKTFEHVNVTCQYDTIMTMCECHWQASEVMKMNWTLNSNVAMVLYGACVCVCRILRYQRNVHPCPSSRAFACGKKKSWLMTIHPVIRYMG